MVTYLVIRMQWYRKKQGVSIKYMDSWVANMTFTSMRNTVIFLYYCVAILAVSTDDIRWSY